MNHNKEKWIDEILTSMDGIKKVSPSPALFRKIESQLFQKEKVVRRILNWRIAAATITILMLNAFAIRHYTLTNEKRISDTSIINDNAKAIISDYNFYR